MIYFWGKPYGLKDQIYQHLRAARPLLRGRSLEACREASPRLMIETHLLRTEPRL